MQDFATSHRVNYILNQIRSVLIGWNVQQTVHSPVTALQTLSLLTSTCISISIYPLDDPPNSYNMITQCGIISTKTTGGDAFCTDLPERAMNNLHDDVLKPVISSSTLITYRNIYCAKCNDEDKIDIAPFNDITLQCTVMILSFRTDIPGQTVQTQIRLLLIRVYTVCHSVCWTHYSMVEPHSSNFRVITTNILVVRNWVV